MAAYAGLLCVLSLIPVHVEMPTPLQLDKVMHVCEYLLFAWLLVHMLRTSELREREYGMLAWMFSTSYGILMEVLQLLVPWRSADWADTLSNAIGAALGVWIAGRL